MFYDLPFFFFFAKLQLFEVSTIIHHYLFFIIRYVTLCCFTDCVDKALQTVLFYFTFINVEVAALSNIQRHFSRSPVPFSRIQIREEKRKKEK